MYNPQLDTFIRVADAGSFNKAAEELYISPPAVIKQINLLEAKLGITIFVRTHRGLSLTKAGESLYHDAKYMIEFCKQSIDRAQNTMREEEDIIRIGTSQLTPVQVLVDLWSKIQEKCPGIKFKIVPFENTPENAREILKNLGQNIDIVCGIFDETLLAYRQCLGLELSRVSICVAVSLTHPLARKEKIQIHDLYGEKLMLIHRGWSSYVDLLRDDIVTNHPQIEVIDFDFYSVEIFNHCESSSDVLMVIDNWKTVHPLLKVLPVEWEYTIPFGLLHSKEPSEIVSRFLKAVSQVIR